MIRLIDVSRRYGRQVLFERLSWSIRPGARLGLVGPNGAGKTTILRIVAGRDLPDTGELAKPAAARIGFLPQEVETVEGGSVLAVARSGAGDVTELEAEIRAVERRMAALAPDDPAVAELTERYGDLRHRFEAQDGDRVEARARRILSGLGVPEARFSEPLTSLSGGWRMRVVLARLLVGRPDLLLLDEPTNHLDLEAIEWLETFLDDWEGAFVVVSHDRYFLNRMARGIVEIELGRLTEYPGSYDDYLVAKAERAELLGKAAERQARERARVERFVERFRFKASKARQVQARVKMLEKQDRVETSKSMRSIRFGFPAAPRSGDVVLRAEGLGKRYGDVTVYDGLDLLVRRGERIALVGPNGAGKSTLLKLVAGKTQPSEGTLEIGHAVVRNYYAQHQLDELDPGASVLEEVERVAPPDLRPRLRSMLGGFLFQGEDVDKQVAVLSGGEKARLALCKLLLRPANLLLLDEPTNHLDLDSREVLEEALDEYEGTLIVISHDRYFMNRVATRVAAVDAGRIEIIDGDYDAWLEWRRREADDAPADEAGSGEARDRRRADRRREADERNRRYRERQAVEMRLAPLEREIAELERRTEQARARQADPDVYADPERARDVARDLAEAEARLAVLYADWEALAADAPPPD